jgi:hypothetical protein
MRLALCANLRFTRRVLVSPPHLPPINECGIETSGVFHFLEYFWSVRTVVEGGVLADSTVSTRRRKHNKMIIFRDGVAVMTLEVKTGPRMMLSTLPDLATAPRRTITTVTTEPRTLALNESAKVRFPTNRPTSKAAQILLEHRIANGTREDGRQ